MKRLLQPAVTVLSFVLLCPASGPADDFSTQLMRATCKLSVANTASTAFLLCRPAPEDPSQKQLIMITAAPCPRGGAGGTGHTALAEETARRQLRRSCPSR